MESNVVRFIAGTPVTLTSPQLIPGAFHFDTETLALFIDLDSKRVQVMDPLKLSLTGGTLTGSVEVVNSEGTTVSGLSSDGVVTGTWLETTADIHLNTTPGQFAVIENGRIRSRSRDEMISDLGVVEIDSLGTLAYKSSATGIYTPVGTVSAPTVTVNTQKVSVVKEVTPGALPTLETNVSGEVLSINFSAGTKTSSTSTEVVEDVTSAEASAPKFTGAQGVVSVS